MRCEIIANSSVRMGEGYLAFDALAEETKKRAATELKLRWLREQYAGKAEFREIEAQQR